MLKSYFSGQGNAHGTIAGMWNMSVVSRYVLLSALVFLLAGASTAHAATIYANSSTGNDTTGTGSVGSPYLTFHKAYTSASATDTIDLTGTFTWTNAGETGDAVTTGYTLAKSLTITGHGPDQTIIQATSTDNSADRRVFTFSSGYTTTIQNLALRYGKVTSANGGCISNAATLTITNVELYNCRSTGGFGGAVYTSLGITITGSAIYSNVAYYGGGGVHLASASADTTTLTNNTIYSNSVTSSGGAFYGGGVYASGLGNIYLTNNTIASNNAGGSYGIGGGLLIYNSSLHLYLENNLIASNTASYYVNTGDFYTYGGTIHNNGYNVIGRAESYSWSTTGDWTDSNGDGVMVLNTAGTTGRVLFAGAAAVNSNPLMTKTWAVLSGSIAVNRGTVTANGAVSVPSTDQRGASRSSTTDIGSYEYGGALVDTTAPTISVTAPTASEATSSTMSLVSSVSDDQGVGGVSWYVDGTLLGNEVTSSPYSTTYDTTATSTGSHTVYAVARDTSSNYATSSTITFTVNNTLPTPSSVVATTTSSTATVTWTTPAAASTRLWFGITSTYASSTAEQDTGTRVTSHTASISGLPACTVLHYGVTGRNAVSASATSTDATFTTSGCTGSASVSATGNSAITTVAGGTLTQGDLTLSVPVSFTATSSSATFQANRLDRTAFFATASAPSGVNTAGSAVFHLVALTDATTTLSIFATPLTVTLAYATQDIEGIDESSLKIYRHDGSAWSMLSACSVNTLARTVSCTTTQFSDFAIFGSASATSSTTSRSTGGFTIQGQVRFLTSIGRNSEALNIMKRWPNLFTSNDLETVRASVALIEGSVPLQKDAVSIATTSKPSLTGVDFARNLFLGMSGEDVRGLQALLVEAQSGPIALELARVGVTGYFGPYTKNALGEYQFTHAIVPRSGYFGPITRAKLLQQ